MGKPIAVKGEGVCFAFPDVCNTPSPSGTTPIPYPNVGQLSETQGESGTVNAGGKPIIHSDSSIPTTTGDEAGSASPTQGEVKFVRVSTTVLCDSGKGVVRMFDTTTQNGGNAIGVVLGGEPTVLVGG